MTDRAAAPPRLRMDAEAFLAWDDGTDVGYELIDGEVLAMVRPRVGHQRVAARLLRAVEDRLPPGHEALPEVLLRIDADAVICPDLSVTREILAGDARMLAAPALVVEILSPSTAANDARIKADLVRALPSVTTIALLRADLRRATVWRRDGARWIVEDVIGQGALDLPPLTAPIPLEAIYAGIVD